jgi:hypothetical protein
MARIIPRNTGAAIVSIAERWFLDAAIQHLDDEYVVFHSVPWVHVDSPRLRQGECDFLILHPRLGVMSIEAKPGDVRYDSRSGNWLTSDGSHLKHDPYIQAQRSAHSINELFLQKIRGWREHRFPFGYAVYFCGADHIKGQLPTHASPGFTLLQGDLSHLDQKLGAISRRFGTPPAQSNHELIRSAISFLRPEFQLVHRFSTQLAMLEDDFYRLTKEQVRVLDLLRDTQRLLIKGCAGSGKTLLAVEKAIRLSREGKRVLLLCYNILLAEWLKTQVSREGAEIVVTHFHGLCEDAAEIAGIPFPVPTGQSELSGFFDNQAPAILEQSIRSGAIRKFDAVIVDEGQDFLPEWWLLIEELLADPKVGVLYVFYDPDQNIFGRQFGFLLEEAKVTLDRVCRNSRQITGFVNGLAGTKHAPADFSVEGPRPEIHEVDSASAERDKIENIIRQLVQGKGIKPERIVILGKRRRANSCLADVESLAGHPLIDESATRDSVGKLRYATIYRFKGLEADCIVLVGFERPCAGQADHLQYCAASRAKSMLAVVYRTDIGAK